MLLGTNKNSAWLSIKRVISQGQATRSTCTWERVIHFMIYTPCVTICNCSSVGSPAEGEEYGHIPLIVKLDLRHFLVEEDILVADAHGQGYRQVCLDDPQ